ncbi:MAG: hypothetical protein QS98_C0012G0016 [archaeon GW2011_AR3]|nr:MAG: hypothetical protein QS98_C0012G0016 [archaeon GW2011_AR3]MBS3109000.1 metallophosphoesterase family protein [Candidatus Woesearchaeota archaeon]
MRILAFTDLHGRINILEKLQEKAKNCDIIACAGDITTFENEMGTLIKSIASFSKPFLIIHGNHEDEVNMERACLNLKNVNFLHKAVYESGKYVFMGFGGGGFMTREPDFEIVSKSFRKHIKPGKKTVLIVHGPPAGTKLDLIDEEHVGCKSYREFIDNNKIDLVICGHLHENAKARQIFKKRTTIINPGADGVIVEL